MANVTIRLSGGKYGVADVLVDVDGATVAQGCIGGEPEDNCIQRDYAWVPVALLALATRLGANVTVDDTTGDDR